MGKKGSRSTVVSDPAPTISFQLGELHIALSSNTPLVGAFAQEFLEDWPSADGKVKTAEKSDIHIHLELIETLPALPPQSPIFVGEGRHLPDGVGTLFVYQQPDGFLLYFQDGGLVRIKSGDRAERLIQGYVTTQLLRYGRLHDLLFTSLSSYLRQRGYYLMHASAAVRGDEAVIFVGASGCGKSTTVLNLALNHWGFLSDDTLLLEKRPDGIYALPTPGGFSVRPKSVAYLPALNAYLPEILSDDFYHLSLHKLGLTYASPARISTIYFTEISAGQENQRRRLSSAVAMAHLIEFSLDKWDATSVPAHISFLEALSRQTEAFLLQIGDQQRIPEMLT